MSDPYQTPHSSFSSGPAQGGYQNPHRGVVILVLGVLSIAFCGFFGIAAWIMGKNDLIEMDAGRMDPSGRELTNAGKIIGMCGVGLLAVTFAGMFVVILIELAF